MSKQRSPRGAIGPSVDARRICGQGTRPFQDDAEVLETARVLFELRSGLEHEHDTEAVKQALLLERKMVTHLHARIRLSPQEVHIVRTFKQHRLSRIEREILLGLALSALGMIRRVRDIEDLQEVMGRNGRDGLVVVKALGTESRLARHDLVFLETADLPVSTEVSAAGSFLDPLLPSHGGATTWKVKRYEELLDRSYGLFQALKERGEALEGDGPSWSGQSDSRKNTLKVRKIMGTFQATVRLHPDWPMRKLTESNLGGEEQQIVLLLLGQELGFQMPDHEIFTGEGLARCVSGYVPEIRHRVRLLSRDGRLRSENHIRVCGGFGAAGAVEDEATLRTCEFELTPECLRRLKIKRKRRSRHRARRPLLRMDQLVLSPDIHRSLGLVIAQVRHIKVLLESWGIGETISYGRGLSVLFSGPPGVGKTAAAEGLAEALEKEIIVANYSEIQSCWVGETEKNISRIFHQATQDGAVLFWDEADSMFFNRDSADRNWEVRDVNVLLQELERFGGLCILATNRKVTLDPALERRLAIKVEFGRPNRKVRRELWGVLVPEKMPLGSDVDLDRLAEADLTGGEIKNVVLNAARIALARSCRGKVRMKDFERAMEMDRTGAWNRTEAIGFGG